MNTLSKPALPFTTGEAQSCGSLTVVPLFAAADPLLAYIGLDEAVARGLAVTEVDEHGNVNLLSVKNPLGERVLLYEGEALVGAKQNRIVGITVLLEAKSVVRVPVDCVERGRWVHRTPQFAPAPQAAYPALRQARASGGGQAAVWASVSAKFDSLDAISDTEAADAIYDRHAGSLDEYAAGLPRLPGQSGVIAAVAGDVVCLDYVSRPDVFAGLYAKLLRGYALDAIERLVEAKLVGADVERFLAGIDRRSARLAETVGIGSAARFDGRVVGRELSAEGELVALTVFPRP